MPHLDSKDDPRHKNTEVDWGIQRIQFTRIWMTNKVIYRPPGESTNNQGEYQYDHKTDFPVNHARLTILRNMI
jgi:hypothetical protein